MATTKKYPKGSLPEIHHSPLKGEEKKTHKKTKNTKKKQNPKKPQTQKKKTQNKLQVEFDSWCQESREKMKMLCV